MTGLTPAQIAERRRGITATDVPAILGMHPYRSVIDVWLEKMGDAPPVEENDRMKWGLLLEGPIRADYAMRHKARLYVPGTLTHRDVAHHKATPDALILAGEGPSVMRSALAPGGMAESLQNAVLESLGARSRVGDALHGMEIKTHRGDRGAIMGSGGFWAAQYGEPGTDEVPEHELLQCAWGMHVCELPRWDLVAFIDGLPEDYTIERNLELEAMLVDAVDRFWIDHVLAKKPPAPDGSRQYTEWLRRRWPGRGPAVQADEQTAAAIERLRDVRRLERQLADRRARYEQAIQASMGDAEAIEANGERITWKRCKDSVHTDWEAVAKEIDSGVWLARGAIGTSGTSFETLQKIDAALSAIDIDHAKQHHTKNMPGARQFRVPRAWHMETE